MTSSGSARPTCGSTHEQPVRLGQAAGETDTGRKRRRNEDAFVCAPPLFAVADGMGGAQAGEVASGLAAAALRESHAEAGGEARVAELVREANRRVHQRATSDAAASGMGTTMTVALVDAAGSVSFGHVGDSRAYLLRGRQAGAADRRPLARRTRRTERVDHNSTYCSYRKIDPSTSGLTDYPTEEL